MVLLGTLAWFALLAPNASAAGNATVSRVGNVVTITASDASDQFRLSLSGSTFIADSSPDGSATDFHAGANCVESAKDVSCAGSGTLTTVSASTEGGIDRVTLDSDLGATFSVDLGAGDDVLFADEALEPVNAEGGDGGDFLSSGAAADRLEGGAGDDGFNGGLGADDFLGGEGTADDVSYGDGVHSMDVSINLDNVRNDGAAGENDLISGVETLRGGSGNDVVTGDSRANTLTGGVGADRIEGGGGFDRHEGGDGNDTLLTRDGLAERAACEGGVDSAITDTIDVPSECETFEAIPDLQPDRDGDGVDKPLDCNDLDGTVRPGAFDRPGDGVDQNCDGADAVDNDRDRDGFVAGFDCDDGDRDIHPGGRERLGNRVDEDCDGVNDPFPAFPTEAALAARLGATTRVVGLVLVDLEGRERVRISCKRKGCKLKARRARAGRRAVSLILDKQVRGLRMKPGAQLIVRVTRRDGVRKLFTFTARSGKPPKQRTRCRAPRGGRVARC